MNMVAEGYYASRCIYNLNKNVNAEIPIAETIYQILWERQLPSIGFENVEAVLV